MPNWGRDLRLKMFQKSERKLTVSSFLNEIKTKSYLFLHADFVSFCENVNLKHSVRKTNNQSERVPVGCVPPDQHYQQPYMFQWPPAVSTCEGILK